MPAKAKSALMRITCVLLAAVMIFSLVLSVAPIAEASAAEPDNSAEVTMTDEKKDTANTSDNASDEDAKAASEADQAYRSFVKTGGITVGLMILFYAFIVVFTKGKGKKPVKKIKK